MRVSLLMGLAWLALGACSQGAASEALSNRPSRIISLDVCADQFVLGLVERDRILALSPDATSAFSHMRDVARDIPQIKPLAEDALALQPDLIVRSYGGGPGATGFFERAGVPVLQVGWASDMDGVRRVILEMGEGLGSGEKAQALIQDMETRLADLGKASDIRALYLTPSGTTTGPGSLIDATLTESGLTNFETRPGWHALSLEEMVGRSPDLVATAYFDDPMSRLDPWSFIRHPVAQDTLATTPRVNLDRAWVSCGSASVIEAVEALNAAAQRSVRP